MSIEERKKLSKYLKHGDINELAKQSGMHSITVSKWINGHLKESGIEVYFEALVEKRRNEVKRKIDKVK